VEPITFEDVNTVLGGDGIGGLPAYTDGKVFITRWRVSLRERLSILLFGNVWVALLGSKHPPIAITGGRGAHFQLPETRLRADCDTVREKLADYAHTAWAGWMAYLFEKSIQNADGTVTIPAWAVERWKRQINTSYAELPEDEKESDRREADIILQIVHGN